MGDLIIGDSLRYLGIHAENVKASEGLLLVIIVDRAYASAWV